MSDRLPEPYPSPLRAHFIRATATTLVVAAVVWLVLVQWLPASVWPPAARPEQCECLAHDWTPGTAPTYSLESLARTIREPQNSWSCLAYAFVALVVLQRSRATLTRWFAAAVALLGLGALLYHASGSRTLRHLDIASLYWVYGMVLCASATRVWRGDRTVPCRRGTDTLLALGALGFAVAVTVFRNIRLGDFKPLHVSVTTGVTAACAATCMAVLCLRRRSRASWSLWLGALALLGVGVLLQIGDRPGNWLCFPGGPVQPHALWHISSAACLWLVAEFLELPSKPVPRA